ncbi:MAG: hypothetical protein AB8H86_29340 [Polyangiales bacterium]
MRQATALTFLGALLLGATTSARAQERVDYHTDRIGAANAYSTAERLSDGDMVVSFRYRGSYAVRDTVLPNAAGFGVALVRLSPSGAVRWAKDLRAERTRIESVSSIHALPGGAFALNAQETGSVLGHLTHAALIRVEADGTLGFTFRDPAPTTRHSMFQVVPLDSGDLVVAGRFEDGAYAPTPEARFHHEHVFPDDAAHFLVRVDGRTGQVRWTSLVPDRLDLQGVAAQGERILVAAKHPNQGSPVSRPIELLVFDAGQGQLVAQGIYRRRHRTWIYGLTAHRDGFALLMAECDRQSDGLCRFPTEAVLLGSTLQPEGVHAMGVRARFLPGPSSDVLRVVELPDNHEPLMRSFRMHTLRAGNAITTVHTPSEPFFPRSLHGASYRDEFILGMVAGDLRGMTLRSQRAPQALAFGPVRTTPPPAEPAMSEADFDHVYGAVFGADSARRRQEQRDTLRRDGVPDEILRQMRLLPRR